MYSSLDSLEIQTLVASPEKGGIIFKGYIITSTMTVTWTISVDENTGCVFTDVAAAAASLKTDKRQRRQSMPFAIPSRDDATLVGHTRVTRTSVSHAPSSPAWGNQGEVEAKEDESEAISVCMTTAVPRTEKISPSHNIRNRHQPNHGKQNSLLPLQAEQQIVLLRAVALRIQSADLELLNAYDLSSEQKQQGEETLHNNESHHELQYRKLSEENNNNKNNNDAAAAPIKGRTPVKRAASAMAKLAQNLVALEKELVPDQPREPYQQLPVKLDYDMIRPRHSNYLDVEYEWALMRRLNAAFSKHHSYGDLRLPRPPSIIPAPYHCLSGDKEALTQWLEWCHMPPNDPTKTTATSWAMHFVKGHLDVRLLASLTDTLAHLHGNRQFERALLQHMNERHANVRSILPHGAMLSLVTTGCHFDTQAKHEPGCRVQRLIQEIGDQACSVMMGAMIIDLHRSDCIIHNDCTLFNILVVVDETNMNEDCGEDDHSVEEKKRVDSSSSLAMDNLLRTSRLVLPNWRMARPGPIGRDLGLTIAWPIACLLWHASQGRDAMVAEIWDFVQAFWEEYSKARWPSGPKIMRGTNTPATTSSTRIFRNMIAWCGWYLYVKIYQQQEHVELFLLTGSNAMISRCNLLESIGVVGLKCMHLGFSGAEPELSLDELKIRFAGAILEEQGCNHLRNESRSMLNGKTSLWSSRTSLLRRVIEPQEAKQ